MTSLLKPDFVRMPLDEAHRVLVAKTLETSADEEAWPIDAARRETLAAARELGEKPTAARFLSVRAERVRERFAQADAQASGKALRTCEEAQLKRFPIPKLRSGTLTLLLAVLAYLAGTAADRWTSDGRIVNLLAAPFLGILLWNLMIYALLVVRSALRPFASKKSADAERTSGARSLLEAIIRKTAGLKLTRERRTFVAQMLVLLEPQICAMAARALHLAAAAFAAGILASIAVRGVGTAYLVGWESTWFADDPARVAQVLEAIYGWLPAAFAPLPALTPETVAAMNLTAGGAQNASPWLIALMSLLLIVVIVPRLLLAGFLSWRIAAARRSVRLALDDDYYDALFEALVPARREVVLYADASLGLGSTGRPQQDADLDLLFERLRGSKAPAALRESLRSAHVERFSIWEDDPAERFGKLAGMPACLWLDAAATPETEVHGEALRRLAQACAPDKAILLLDLSSLAQRFGSTADNVRMRRALWTRFAESFGVDVVVLGI